MDQLGVESEANHKVLIYNLATIRPCSMQAHVTHACG